MYCTCDQAVVLGALNAVVSLALECHRRLFFFSIFFAWFGLYSEQAGRGGGRLLAQLPT